MSHADEIEAAETPFPTPDAEIDGGCKHCDGTGKQARTFTGSIGLETPWRPKGSGGREDEMRACPACSKSPEMTKGLEVQRKGMNSQEQWRAARQRLRELTPEPDELDYMTKVCEQIHYLLRLADTIIDRQAEQLKSWRRVAERLEREKQEQAKQLKAKDEMIEKALGICEFWNYKKPIPFLKQALKGGQ